MSSLHRTTARIPIEGAHFRRLPDQAPAPPHDAAEIDIPVMRPKLPDATHLLPYLQRIDASRTYSNWGPLSSELECRLARMLLLPEGGVISASSGTAALIGSMLAVAGRAVEQRPLALMPAYTFVATAVAAQQCGYHPFLADINPVSWTLDPERLAAELDRSILERCGIAIPVAPLGRPVPQAPWLEFQRKTGIPVVIDGAASFEGVFQTPEQFLGEIPVAMSFHATKALATGEGGCVALGMPRLAVSVTRSLNFGFHEARESTSPSINGKMSEYHAAVGLAELDGWTEKQTTLRAVATEYRHQLFSAGLSEYFYFAPDVSSNYALCHCASPDQALRVQVALQRSCIDYRLWYGRGLQHHAYYADLEHESLAVTCDLAPRLLGLPMSMDLTESEITRIVVALSSGLSES